MLQVGRKCRRRRPRWRCRAFHHGFLRRISRALVSPLDGRSSEMVSDMAAPCSRRVPHLRFAVELRPKRQKPRIFSNSVVDRGRILAAELSRQVSVCAVIQDTDVELTNESSTVIQTVGRVTIAVVSARFGSTPVVSHDLVQQPTAVRFDDRGARSEGSAHCRRATRRRSPTPPVRVGGARRSDSIRRSSIHEGAPGRSVPRVDLHDELVARDQLAPEGMEN